MHLGQIGSEILDDFNGGIVVVDAVPAMRFVRRIAEPNHAVSVGRIGGASFAAVSPEVGTGEGAVGGKGHDLIKGLLVVFILVGSWRARKVLVGFVIGLAPGITGLDGTRVCHYHCQ